MTAMVAAMIAIIERLRDMMTIIGKRVSYLLTVPLLLVIKIVMTVTARDVTTRIVPVIASETFLVVLLQIYS